MNLGQHGRKRVLVVDDCAATREILTMILEVEGYEVAGAGDGQEALGHLRRPNGPDLVLLDLMMPVLNGWEFLELWRQDPRLTATPVIVFSAVGDASPDAIPPGVAAAITKPLDEDSLIDRLVETVSAVLAPKMPPTADGEVPGPTA